MEVKVENQGISRLTAYEIASNPDDINITYAGPDKKTEKFSGWITRGEKHNFKPLLNTQPIFDTPEKAKEAMKDLVKRINEFVEKDLNSPENKIKEFFTQGE